MFKYVKISDTETAPVFYPADRHTSFKVEGRPGFYTIIDVVSAGQKIFALLESNTLGEEDTVIVSFGHGCQKNIWVLEKYNHSDIDVNLKDKAAKVIFIPHYAMVTDEVYDSLSEVLLEDGIIDPAEYITNWKEKEIDNRSIDQGGIIR